MIRVDEKDSWKSGLLRGGHLRGGHLADRCGMWIAVKYFLTTNKNREEDLYQCHYLTLSINPLNSTTAISTSIASTYSTTWI